MGDTRKIVPRIIETSTENIPSEVIPGTIILDRDTDKVSFDASDGIRHEVSGGAQSDYNSFDESDASFIKNRPFYRDNGRKLSGNIVKNPVPIDDSSGGYVCDKVNLSEDQSEDITVSVIVNSDTGESVTAQGHVSTMGELVPSGEALPAQFASVIVLYVEDDYGDFEIIFYDGMEPDPDSATGMKLSDTHSMSMLDNISVNTIDVGKIKYLDPLFIKPYRPDYNETDPNSPNFIKNKVVDMSKSYRTLKPETSYGEPYVQAIYGWGLDSDGIGELKLDVKFKDGTEERYLSYSSSTPSNFPTDSEESKASFLVSTNFTRYDAESSSSVTICTITSAAGVEVTHHLGPDYGTETYMSTMMLCAFDEKFFNTMDSFTLTGEFLSVKLIPQDLIYGLNQRFDKLMSDIQEVFSYYYARMENSYNDLRDDVTSYHEDVTNVEKDIKSLRSQNKVDKIQAESMNYWINKNIEQELHTRQDLTRYLYREYIGYGHSNGYNVDVPLFRMGYSNDPFEIVATNVSHLFARVEFRDSNYEDDVTNISMRMHLKLTNAENLDYTFSELDLMHSKYQYSNWNYEKEEYETITRVTFPNQGEFSVTLCHDITSAEGTFQAVHVNALKTFTIKGDPSLGRRVKIYGTGKNNNTFSFSYSNFEQEEIQQCIFLLENLDFMESVDFDTDLVTGNVDYMVNVIDQLHDYSLDEGELPTNKYCTFGSEGVGLLSADQIKVASDKGWKIN